MGDRKAAEEELLHFIELFSPGTTNVDVYRDRLSKMNDTQFAQFIGDLQEKRETLALFIPNLQSKVFTTEHFLKCAEAINHDFFQYLYLTEPDSGQLVKTPIKHMVITEPVRRQVQMLQKKTSIPENNRVVDERSGQAAHESKGSSISYPELQALNARGFSSAILELIKARGGDEKAYNHINRQIIETGRADLSQLDELGSSVASKDTLKVLLTGMHLRNSL